MEQRSHHRESGLFQKNAVLAELTGKSLSLPLSRARDSIRKSRVTPPSQRRSKQPEGTVHNNSVCDILYVVKYSILNLLLCCFCVNGS